MDAAQHGHERETQAAARDREATDRDSEAARRDVVSHDRDVDAIAREERSRDADQVVRDGLWDRRRHAESSDASDGRSARGGNETQDQAEIDRRVARSETEWAEQELADRLDSAGAERREAAADRRSGRADREAAATDRASSAADRVAAADDREAAAADRQQSEVDDNLAEA